MEKALKLGASASRNSVPSCSNDAEIIEKCTRNHPMIKLTPADIDAINAAFLAERLSADVVNKMSNDVFSKLADDRSLDELFEISVRVNDVRFHLSDNNVFPHAFLDVIQKTNGRCSI